jgi:hypothetical protein
MDSRDRKGRLTEAQGRARKARPCAVQGSLQPRACAEVDVAHALGPRCSSEEEHEAVPGEGRPGFARGRVHAAAQVRRSRPWLVEGIACGGPHVLTAERSRAIGREDDLAPVLADVGLDVVRSRVVQLGNWCGRAEASAGVLRADEDVAGDAGGAPGEVEQRLVARLDVRGALLVETAVRAARCAGEMTRLVPSSVLCATGEVDVPEPTRLSRRCGSRRRARRRVRVSGRSRPRTN